MATKMKYDTASFKERLAEVNPNVTVLEEYVGSRVSISCRFSSLRSDNRFNTSHTRRGVSLSGRPNSADMSENESSITRKKSMNSIAFCVICFNSAFRRLVLPEAMPPLRPISRSSSGSRSVFRFRFFRLLGFRPGLYWLVLINSILSGFPGKVLCVVGILE